MGIGGVAAAALAMSACVSSMERYGERSRDLAVARLGARVGRRAPSPSVTSARPSADVLRLLRRRLSSDDVVRVALANNRDLVARFGELGVSRAALLAASMPSLPTLEEGAVRFPTDGHEPSIELTVLQDLTDLVLLPLRRSAVDAETEATTVSVARATLELAFEARRAHVAYVAAEQSLSQSRAIFETADAAALAARSLYEAGNVPQIDMQTERAFAEDARTTMWRAEESVVAARERLNVLMGLTGAATRWNAPSALPAPPPVARDRAALARLAERAVDRSLDLTVSRLRIVAAGRRLRASRVANLVPEIALGVSVAREEGEWSVGPAVTIGLPFVGPRSAARAGAIADLERLRAGHIALGVRIESAARGLGARLEGARRRAVHARDVIVPLRRTIVEQRLLDYNAMQIGVGGLLDAQRASVEAEQRATDALRDYWLARFAVEQLAAGRLPDDGGAMMDSPSTAEPETRGAH